MSTLGYPTWEQKGGGPPFKSPSEESCFDDGSHALTITIEWITVIH